MSAGQDLFSVAARIGEQANMRMRTDQADMEMRGERLNNNVQIGTQYIYADSGPKLYAAISLSDSTGANIDALAPGKRYQLWINTGPLESGGLSMPVGVYMRYRAVFYAADTGQLLADLPVLPHNLNQDEINAAREFGSQVGIDIQIPPACPAVLARLVLLAEVERETASGSSDRLPAKEVAQLKIRLQGNQPFIPASNSMQIILPDVRDAPDGIACLWVQHNDVHVSLIAFCKGVPLPGELVLPTSSNLAFANAYQADIFFRAAGTYAQQHMQPFWRWRSDALRLGSPIESITLLEPIEKAFPWELIFQHKATLARWATIVRYGDVRSLQVQPDQRTGTVLALLPPGAISPACLNQVDSEQVGDAYALVDRILSEPQRFALVYISAADAGLLNELTNCLLFRDQEIEAPRPIFFIDVAGSAGVDPTAPESGGLASSLLATIADGLIGIVPSQLPPGCAPLGERILDKLIIGASPLTALREIRRELHQAYNPRMPIDTLVGAHMYVYFGNPLLQLSLRRANQGERP